MKNQVINKQDTIDFIENSILISDVSEKSTDHYLLNMKEQRVAKISLAALKSILGVGRYNTFYTTCHVPALFQYRPDVKEKLFVEDFFQIFNVYNPPRWQEDEFFSEVESKKPLGSYPAIYKKFLEHLTENDALSEEYILDWLSTALKGKNITYLSLIGAQGIGKGVLGSICGNLFGSNYRQVSDRVIKSSFNAQIKNTCLLNIDEVQLTTTEQVERLKSFSNEFIEVEEKGKDSEVIKNFANIYISSNRVDGLKVEVGDRRFSFVNLTCDRLEDNLSQKEIDLLLLDGSLVDEFVYFLLDRKIVNNMSKPFVSRKTHEVLEASLSDWARWLLYSYIPAERVKFDNSGVSGSLTISINDVKEAMLKDLPYMGNAPGRNKFKNLANSYKTVFTCKSVRGHSDSTKNGDFIEVKHGLQLVQAITLGDVHENSI